MDQNSKFSSNHKSLKYMSDKKELNISQRIWLKFLKDYDFALIYHPGKFNALVDALSRKTLYISALMVKEMYLIEHFIYLLLMCELMSINMKFGMLRVTNNMLEKTKDGQKLYLHLLDQLALINQGK